ncbi:MAG: hypothetical protein IBJ10_01355 [Phycisphaerales bacterium]|nr:hypothetical protein [Phycisphaerales bacterium]
MPRTIALLTLACVLLAPCLRAQDEAPPPAEAPAQPDWSETAPPVPEQTAPGAPAIDFASLPPQIRLGVRVALVRQNIPVHSTVVIVPDASAYIEAIGEWRTEARFPVLIDDGSAEAAESIARFVRAFRPDAVVRWPGSGQVWAQSIEVLRQRVDDAAARAFGAENREKIRERWEELRFAPMGVVVASIKDPAWAGALAMAAGYGQPIAWVDVEPRSLAGEVAPEEIAALNGAVASLCESLELPFAGFGDAVDAFTVCLNMPTKHPGADGPLAVTDLLGRNEQKLRWAYVGLMPGDAPTSAYRAMCSLFLNPRSGWFVDGYESRRETAGYDVNRPAAILRERGVVSVTDRSPGVGRAAWRSRAALGVDAGFIHLNSSGQRRWFRLLKDDVDASDIPLLRTPSIVHMIHSFSAQNPDDGQSIAARWMDRGAYVYFGSVDEPYLRAFQNPQTMARRWSSKAPFSIAVRVDGLEPWKLNYFGDPLLTLTSEPQRKPGAPALSGLEPLDGLLRAAIRERRLADAARMLVLMGRDEDAAGLFAAALADKDHEVSPELAEACFYPLVRAGDVPGAVSAFERMSDRARRSNIAADTLWLAARPRLALVPPDLRTAQVLKANVRPHASADDAEALAPALRRMESAESVRAWLQTLANETKNQKDRQRLTELLSRY